MKLIFTLNKGIQNTPRTSRQSRIFHCLYIYVYYPQFHSISLCSFIIYPSHLFFFNKLTCISGQPCLLPLLLLTNGWYQKTGKWLRYVFPSFLPGLFASVTCRWGYRNKGSFAVQLFFRYFNLKPTNVHFHFIVYSF